MMDIVNRIESLNGQQIRLVTKTEPILLKKSKITKQFCPYVGVVRVVSRIVEIGTSYTDLVNKERMVEGLPPNFIALPLWHGKGKRVPNSKFLYFHIDTGEKYIAFRHVKAEGEFYQDKNGKVISPDALQEYWPNQSTSRQGIKEMIEWRLIKIENILSVDPV